MPDPTPDVAGIVANARLVLPWLDGPTRDFTRERADDTASVVRALLAHLDTVSAERDRLRADLDDCWKQQSDIVGRLTDELDALQRLAHDFTQDDANNLRDLPNIPWHYGGEGGVETVEAWRKDLADRVERLALDAARSATQDNPARPTGARPTEEER